MPSLQSVSFPQICVQFCFASQTSQIQVPLFFAVYMYVLTSELSERHRCKICVIKDIQTTFCIRINLYKISSLKSYCVLNYVYSSLQFLAFLSFSHKLTVNNIMERPFDITEGGGLFFGSTFPFHLFLCMLFFSILYTTVSYCHTQGCECSALTRPGYLFSKSPSPTRKSNVCLLIKILLFLFIF